MPWVWPSSDDPAGCGVGLLDRDRVVRLGGAVVLHEHHRGVRPDRELADESVVGARIAEHPAAAVHIEHGRQDLRCAGGLDDADGDVADFGRHGDPRLVGVGLGDRRGLDVIEDLAGAVRPELVEERRLRRGVGDLLGRRLQGVVAHGGSFRDRSRCNVSPWERLRICGSPE